ncbi:uncharacterized protein LOC143123484 [Alosa pseudoharengus]|uniref:uncharacterized protein LOC143123484 n=1 Tax=Alosa pseudoharengus TaxID=34774 RepID=UPI003F8A5265
MFGAPSPQQQPPARPPAQQQHRAKPPAQQQPPARLPAQAPPKAPGQGPEQGPTVSVPPSVPVSEPPKEMPAKDLVQSSEGPSLPPQTEPQQPTAALSMSSAPAAGASTTTTTAADTTTMSADTTTTTTATQSVSSETSEPKGLPASSETSEPPKGLLSMFSSSSPSTQPGSLLSGILPGSAGTESPAKGLLSTSSAAPTTTSTTEVQQATTTEPKADTTPQTDTTKPSTEATPQVSQGQVESTPDGALHGAPPPKETPAVGLLSMFGGSSSQGAPSQVGSLLGGILPGSTESKDIPGKGLFSMFSGPSPPTGPGQAGATLGASAPPQEPPGKGLLSMFGGPAPQQSAPQASSLFGGILPGAAASKEVPGKGLLSMFGGPSPTSAESGPPKTGAFGLFGSLMEEAIKKPEPPKPQDVTAASVAPVPEQTTVSTTKADGTQEEKSQGQTVTVKTQMSLSQAPSSTKGISSLPEPSSILPGQTDLKDGKDIVSDQVPDKPVSASAPETQTTSEPSIKAETPSSNLQSNVTATLSTQEAKPIAQPPTAGAQTEQTPADAAKSVLDSSADAVSGFMSKMFSGPTAPSAAPSTGFFSQSSFFKSAPAPQQQQQPKPSLFGFTSSLPTDSNLFGMFKAPESPKPQPQQRQPPGVRPPNAPRGQGPPPTAPGPGTVPVTQGIGVSQTGPSDTTSPSAAGSQSIPQASDKTATIGDVIHEKPMVIIGEPAKDTDKSGLPLEGIPLEPPIIQQLQSTEPPPTKTVFEMPGLSGSAFGFMAGSGDGGKSLGSLFSSPPTVTQADGAGLLTGFRNFSTGLFQDEKPDAANDQPSAASVFGAKLGFPWQKDTPMPSTPQQPGIVTTQPKANNDNTVITNGTHIESLRKDNIYKIP